MSKKVVLTLELRDNKDKQKAMKAVSGLPGVESLAMNMKDKKLTVIGDVDPVEVVGKLRKFWHTELVTVGPSKEPEKKNVDKDSGKKEIDEKKMVDFWNQYMNLNNINNAPHVYYSAEENPNSCVIS